MLRTSSARFGFWILLAILSVAMWASVGILEPKTYNLANFVNAQTAAGTNYGTVTANALTVTNVVVNNATSVTLIANATQTVTVSFSVSGGQGCGNIFFNGGNITSTLYRYGVSTTCGIAYPAEANRNYLNCYVVSTSTQHSCGSAASTTAANATATFAVYYFAEATDASSSYASQDWHAFAATRSASGTSGSATSSSGVEMNTLLGLNVETSSLNYGTVNPGTDTTSTNQVATVKNAGNSSTTLRLNGTAMTSGGNSIATSSQHYSTSTFTYNTNDNQLQPTATDVGGFSIPRPPLAVWATTTAYPNAIRFHPAVVNNGYVYIMGGELNTGSTSTVRYAPIGATGSLGSWATTTPLPSAILNHFAVTWNNFLYLTGGATSAFSGVQTSTVLYVAIGATGTLGSWATTTALPSGNQGHSAVVNNGYVYIIGGSVSLSTATSTVLYAAIGATGTLGSWATTTVYPNTITDLPAVLNNGYLYAIGGNTEGSGFTSTVRYASIGSTGTLGSWATATAYPNINSRFPAVVNNGFVYAIGGYNGSVYTSTVRYAAIGSTGTLGSWAATADYPNVVGLHPAVVNNGFVYAIGGFNGSDSTSTVLYASLASRNTYWGLGITAGTLQGVYSSTVTYTAVFQP